MQPRTLRTFTSPAAHLFPPHATRCHDAWEGTTLAVQYTARSAQLCHIHSNHCTDVTGNNCPAIKSQNFTMQNPACRFPHAGTTRKCFNPVPKNFSFYLLQLGHTMVAKAWRLAKLPVTSWQVHAAPERSKWWTVQDLATIAASSGFSARLNGMICEACLGASSTSGAASTLLQ